LEKVLVKMGTAFKKALFVFLGFIVVLGGVLVGVILNYSQYDSLPEKIQMVDFSGMLLAVLGACVLSLVSVALTFWLARAWASEQPELGDRIIRLALAVSISLIVVFGGLAGGLIILRTLWTIGFF
jgi:hypothetical protein